MTMHLLCYFMTSDVIFKPNKYIYSPNITSFVILSLVT
jgi:hypothetical protein